MYSKAGHISAATICVGTTPERRLSHTSSVSILPNGAGGRQSIIAALPQGLTSLVDVKNVLFVLVNGPGVLSV